MTDAELHDAIRHAVSPLLSENCPVCGDSAKIADAVLAAIRAAGRLAPEATDDVTEAAMLAYWRTPGGTETGVLAAGAIFAANARRNARQECAEIAASFDNCGTDSDPRHTIPCDIAAAIRTGSAS